MDNEKKSIQELNKDINVHLCYLFFTFSYLIFKLAFSPLPAPSQQFATLLVSLFYSISQSKLTEAFSYSGPFLKH